MIERTHLQYSVARFDIANVAGLSPAEPIFLGFFFIIIIHELTFCRITPRNSPGFLKDCVTFPFFSYRSSLHFFLVFYYVKLNTDNRNYQKLLFFKSFPKKNPRNI